MSNAPWARTGYGNQTALFTPRLRDLGHDVAIFGFYGAEGGMLNWDGMKVYPKAYHGYGVDVIAAHATHHQADIAVTLIDAWVMTPDQWKITAPGMRWVPWFPIDMEPAPPPIVRKVADAFQGLVYSRYAERECQRAGLDVRYVPHGVNLYNFKPMSREEARVKLGWPADKWIAVMVAANKGTPSRKSFPEVMEAFGVFCKKHPDALMYLHTHPGPEQTGLDLRALADATNTARKVLFADPYAMLLGLGDDYMRAVYSAADVLLSPSMGEGFGIPILEAQACGCPVITGDWTSMSELTWKGIAIPKASAHRAYTPLQAWQFYPDQGAILDALETVYANPPDRDRPAQVADYEAGNVARKYWQPVLAELEQRIGPREKVPA